MNKAFLILGLLLQASVVQASVVQASVVQASGLDENEQKMIEWIDAHSDDAVALLKESVDIPSGTLNLPGIRSVGDVLRRELDELGLGTEWIDMPAEMNRAGHLVAKQTGSRNGAKKILLIGHLDTVFETEDGHRPFERDGNIARGHGVYDMKTGNTVIIYALRALAEVGVLKDIPLVVFFTGDEEKSGQPLSVSRQHLLEAGEWADVSLGFEEAMYFDDTDWATIARRSSSGWLLTVEGKQSHSSNIFNDETGAGAIFEASRILHEFYEDVRGPEHLTFNAGTIQGGTEVSYDPQLSQGKTFGKNNVVPRQVIVRGGIRTISQQQLDDARQAMRDVVARNLPFTNASIEFLEGYPPMSPTAGNIGLQSMLSTINVELGRKPMPALDPSRRGAADISFVAPMSDALAGLGGIGGGGHTPDEFVELDSISLAVKRAAILMYRLSSQSALE